MRFPTRLRVVSDIKRVVGACLSASTARQLAGNIIEHRSQSVGGSRLVRSRILRVVSVSAGPEDYHRGDRWAHRHEHCGRNGSILFWYHIMDSPANPAYVQGLTMRWSERRTAVRVSFEMTSTLPLRATRGLVRRRSSCSR